MSVPKQITASIEDRELLMVIFVSGGEPTQIYALHRRYRLSPAQIARSVRKFESIGVLCLTGHAIKLTDYGRRWVLANRLTLFGKPHSRLWKEVPQSLLAAPDRANEYYTPRQARMGKHFLEDMSSSESHPEPNEHHVTREGGFSH